MLEEKKPQQIVIEYFINHPTSTNIEISNATGISKSSVQRYLSNPHVGNIGIPSTGRTISEQIKYNTSIGRQKGGRNTFSKYKPIKEESGRFIGLVMDDTSEKEITKREDIIFIVREFSENPYVTLDQLTAAFDGKYTVDYVYRCLTDSRVREMFGTLIAGSITNQLDQNRYGILRKFGDSWNMELFESAGLTDHEKEVLEYRFSIDGIRSADATARKFGISKTAVTKLEDRAIRKITEYQESKKVK